MLGRHIARRPSIFSFQKPIFMQEQNQQQENQKHPSGDIPFQAAEQAFVKTTSLSRPLASNFLYESSNGPIRFNNPSTVAWTSLSRGIYAEAVWGKRYQIFP